MAATATETITEINLAVAPAKRKLVCFSFAAYAKTLIAHLKSRNIQVSDGLSDEEFSRIESTFSFTFPPDLRSVLQAGLPISHGFPNWRSSSHQQLGVLINSPVRGLLAEVAGGRFWSDSWRVELGDRRNGLDRAREVLGRAPILIPIYRDLYIPASPAAAGNPVFYIRGGDVRVSSFDLSGFFQEVEFLKSVDFRPPAWAATAARRVEVWTDVVETGRRVGAGRGGSWWRGEVGGFMEEMFWKLRDGGWSEEEVREMMAVADGGGAAARGGVRASTGVLAVVLSRAGWSREDVVDSLGIGGHDQSGDTLFEFQGSSLGQKVIKSTSSSLRPEMIRSSLCKS